MNYVTTFNVLQNTPNVCLAYGLHVFGKGIDTCSENKYKCELAIVHFYQDKVKAKAAEK